MNATTSAAEPPPPASSSSTSAGTPVYIWVVTAFGVLVLVIVFRLVRYGALWGGRSVSSSRSMHSRGSNSRAKSSSHSVDSSSRRRGSSALVRSNSTDPLALSADIEPAPAAAAPAAAPGDGQPHISTFDDPSAPVASAVLNIQSLMRTFTPRHVPAQDGGLPLAVPRKVEYRSPSEVGLNEPPVDESSQELASGSNLIHTPAISSGALHVAPTSPAPAHLPLAPNPPASSAQLPVVASSPPKPSSVPNPSTLSGSSTAHRPIPKVVTVPNAPPISSSISNSTSSSSTNQLAPKPSSTSLRPPPATSPPTSTSPIFRPAPDPSRAGLTTLTTLDADSTTSIKRPLKAFTPTHYVIRSGGEAMTVDRPPPSAVIPTARSKPKPKPVAGSQPSSRPAAAAAAAAASPAVLPNAVPPAQLPAPIPVPPPAHGAPPIAIPVSTGSAQQQHATLVPVVYYVAADAAGGLPPGTTGVPVMMGTPMQVVVATGARQAQRGRR
ncbi:hypothetical protein BCR44DRAFT_65284 [Catenaria anguillulae PL171]|uniref:Uncharacterized protein n=1 Tax=Catenaria anguillulae PL171 TaxID=765915 RepID=A0A1Y2HI84_9FUNG|nr:hypothetical protein BCR44DRAFT_65284 [Catenaria anguillulae PL171]